MKAMYIFYFLLLGTLLSAQDCNVSVTTSSNSSIFCCHDLIITNNSVENFAAIRLIPLTTMSFENVLPKSSNWVMSNAGPSQIVFSSNVGNGLIPPGVSTPIEFCLESFSSAPQRIRVEWLGIMGNVLCEEIIELSCPKCMIIDHENELICENGGYRFDFDFTNVFNEAISEISINPINCNPVPTSINPTSITFATPIAPGATSTGHSFWFDLPVTSGTFEFVIEALCPTNCNCVSDTIRLEIPDCCSDPCQDVSVTLNSENEPSEYCCWSLDLDGVCDTAFFSGIKIEVPPGIYMSYQEAGFGWYVDQATGNSAIWRPLNFNNNGKIDAGPILDKIIFCILGVDDNSEVPQNITVSWLDANDDVACDTLLQTFCQPTIGGDCVIAKQDTIICEQGLYKLKWSLDNVGNFTATNLYMPTQYFNPSSPGTVAWQGGSFPMTGLNFAANTSLAMPDGLFAGLNPGDQFCFTISLTDAGLGNEPTKCCHTDFICFIMPPCDTPLCEEPCDGLYYALNQIDPDSTYCCHELELAVSCDTTYIGVCLEALDGVQFDRMSVPFDYAITNLSATKKIIKPTAFHAGAPYFVPGDTLRSIEFCLSGIHNNSQTPQRVVLSWLDINGEAICSDTLEFKCPPTPPGNCIVVLNDTIKCEPPGHYAFCFDIKNVGQFTGKYISVHGMHTKPGGGIFTPAQYNQIINFPVGSVISIPPIHINGSSPGDTLCYVVSIYDDPSPSGYNNCCHTDTLCIVLPDCGDETVCDSVSWDTLSTQGSCCFTLEVDNQFSATYFSALKLTALNPGVIVATASTYPDWQVTPCPGGYLIEYTGAGAPNIPLGLSVPIDFCVSGYTTTTQTLELTWLKPGPNGEFIVECCQGLVLNCQPPAPSIPCFEISEMSSTCEDDVIKFHFKLMNNTNLGATAPGYSINRLTFNPLFPSGVSFVPDPLIISSPLAPGAMNYYTVDVIGVGQGQTVHFSAGVHAVTDSTIDCCVSDSTYCFTTAECDTSTVTYCDTLTIDTLFYEGWCAVTCGPSANPNPVSANPFNEVVVGLMDLNNHPSAPLNTNWSPTKLGGIGANNWDYQTLGKVFGLATDPRRGHIYVAATELYDINVIHWGMAGQPAIYKIDLSDGAVSTVITSINTCISTSPYNQIPNYIDPITNKAPAFGNIAFNHKKNILYVSNLEDGVIYAVDLATGSVIGGFDPWNIDSGNCGKEVNGELIFGIQYHQQHQKLYFHKNSDEFQSAADPISFQEIWSVDLTNKGLFNIGSYQKEFDIPDFFATPGYSNPVTDISFSANGNIMLLAERGVIQPTGRSGSAHATRLLEYRFNGVVWNPTSVTKHRIGDVSTATFSSMDNSAGGSDFVSSNPADPLNACDSTVLCSGNALDFRPGPYIYGLQGLPLSGGTVANSFLVDFDGVITNGASKYDLGDVETFRNMCCGNVPAVDSCCQDEEYFINQLLPATRIEAISLTEAEVDNPLMNDCHQLYISWGDTTAEEGPYLASDIPVVHQYPNVGDTYLVCVRIEELNDDGAICFEDSICKDVTIVSIKSPRLIDIADIYPTPFTTSFTLKSSWESSIKRVNIYNIFGSLVGQYHINSRKTTFDGSSWSAGVYLLEAIDVDGNIGRRPIIKQ